MITPKFRAASVAALVAIGMLAATAPAFSQNSSASAALEARIADLKAKTAALIAVARKPAKASKSAGSTAQSNAPPPAPGDQASFIPADPRLARPPVSYSVPGALANFTDCPEACPAMMVIPAGEYTMGSPQSEPLRDDDEWPQHRVLIERPFAVGRYEVTRGEYAAFSKETGRSPTGGCYTDRAKSGSWEVDPQGDWTDPSFRQTDRDPVVCVTWDDAQAYVQWLSRKTGHAYRLPSEAEFEYVARAGTTSSYWWGPNADQGCASANIADAAFKAKYPNNTVVNCNDGALNTAPVGSYRPNAFGVYDILGNAWEWTADCANDSYAGAPDDGSVWTEGDCSRHIFRGGSWDNGLQHFRSANRSRSPSAFHTSTLGFRVARTL